ncbi:MAG: hypothetical protein AAB560_03420, partial [Patescibacteria group bacterium]
MFKKVLFGIFIPIFAVGFSLFILFPQTAEAGDVADAVNDAVSDVADAIADTLGDPFSEAMADIADGASEFWAAPFAGDIILDCLFNLFGFCDGQNQNSPEWASEQEPESCGACASCGDSRYRWCTGGQYGSGTCVDFTCDCRPDLCNGGGGGGGGGGPPPPPPPASVDLRVNGVDSLGSPLEVPASFTLSWTTANADSCSASGNWSGGKSTGGSESFSDIPRGTYSYTLNCSGPGGSGSDSVSFQIVQVPRCSLSANPVQIVRPQ